MNQYVKLRDLYGDMISAFENGIEGQDTQEFERQYQEIVGTTRDRAAFMVKQLKVFYKLVIAKSQYGAGDGGEWLSYINSKAPRPVL